MFIRTLLFLMLLTNASIASAVKQATQLPYQQEIQKLLEGMDYSAFETLTRPDVELRLDFDRKTWTLTKVHRYDAQGNILLEQGRFGLCAELATYMYQHLSPKIKEDHEIRFASATENGFFPTYQSNHIVLLMYDKKDQHIYLIDPSFHRYGNIRDFGEYRIFGVQDSLSFMKDRSEDVTYGVDQAIPLFIKNDFLLSFSVSSVDGKFDKDNYLLAVTANLRHKVAGLNILMVGRYNGKIESFETKGILQEFLDPKQLAFLQAKFKQWLIQQTAFDDRKENRLP